MKIGGGWGEPLAKHPALLGKPPGLSAIYREYNTLGFGVKARIYIRFC
jgi:hypothetical protein